MSDTQSAAPAAPVAPAASSEAQPITDAKAPVSAAPDAPVDEEIQDDLSDVPSEEQEKLTKAEEKEAKRLYKLKVAGKELSVDETELLKRAQMGYSADQKWQEAAQLKKQVEGFIQLLQQDPTGALQQLGFDIDDMAEKHLQRRIEEMKKSPEQLEREKLQKEVERLQKEAKDREEAAREIERQQMQQKFAVDIETDILSSLDDPKAGLPKSPYFIKRIADTMLFAMKNKVNITAKDAINIIKDEVKSELRDLYSATPDEVFEEMIGKDRLTKYRKSKVKKPSKPIDTASTVKATGASEQAKETKDKAAQKIRQRDFFKNLGTK